MALAVCMVLSLMALVEPKGYTVSAEAAPVLLANSPEAAYEQLTFSDFGVADGQILNQNKWTSEVKEGDLDEILFRGKFTFPTVEQSKQFGNIYLGKADWWTIVLNSDSAGNIIVDAIGATFTDKTPCNLTATNPDLQLRGEEVEIAISIQYENTTASATDLKIGVWIDGALSKGGYIYAKNAPLSNLTRCLHFYDADANSTVTVASVKGEITAPSSDVLLSASEENSYEKLTFADFGVADGEILKQGSGHWASDVLEGNLNEVLFQGKYTFPTMEKSKQFGHIYLGRANWWAIGITQDSAGNIMISVPSGTVENTFLTNLTANNPDVQLRGEEVEIAISVKYENTTSTTTDLKIGVWFNGVLQNDGYIIVKNAALADLTRCLHTYDQDANTSVTVASVGKTLEPADVLLSESAENDYEKLTFADFGIADGDILNQGVNQHFISDVVPAGDLNETLFLGKYTFPTMEQSPKFGNIYVGLAKYYGIAITADSQGNILFDVISTSVGGSAMEAGNDRNMTLNSPVELRGREVEIAISVKYENTTSTTTDLKIGVWVDGVLMQGKYLYARNVTRTDLNRCFHTLDTDSNSVVKVASVGKTLEPADVLLSESEEDGYEKLTFADFKIEDGDILHQGSGHWVSDVLEGDLNEVLFQGKFTFPTMDKAKQFGNIYLGRANWWTITLNADSAGNIIVDAIGAAIEDKTPCNLTATNPDLQLRGEEVEIAISVKYENTTSLATDLKIGVWLNGVLSKGGYIIAKNVPLTDLTRCFHTYDTDGSSTVKVASVGKSYVVPDVLLSESEENGYEKLTFADFGAMDGQLLSGKAGEKTNYATLPGTLDGILFQGKYTFPTVETAKQFGNIYLGRPDWWAIGIAPDSAGNICLNVVSDGSSVEDNTLCNLTVRYGDVQLRGEEVEIAISVKYENTTETKTDLKIGVWVNGALKQGKYIYARNVLLSDLVKCLHTYDSANDAAVGITSVGQWTQNTLPTDLADLTLSDGNIPDGNTFTYGNFARVESLDKTLFSANVQFNTAGARLHLGCTPGAVNGYSGLGLRLEGNGTLVLGNELATVDGAQDNELTSIGLNFLAINPRVAGFGDTFAGKSFLLQLSTEFVDCDNDGQKDDIKLGIFFDGVLYCNNYIYIPNEAQTLSTGVNFNGGSEGFAQFSSVLLKELTNTDLGISKGTYTAAVNGTAATEMLDGTAVTAEVTFSEKGSVAYGKEGKGIVFTCEEAGALKVSYVSADGTVSIGEVKIPENRAVTLRTTFVFLKNGEKTNLKLGVYADGKLSGYEYFIVEDVDTSVLTASMSVSNVKIGANSYAELTLRDFMVADKTRSDFGGRFATYEGASFHQTTFSAVLGFSDETEKKNDNCFYLGGKQWAGLRVELDGNGNLAISFVHGDGVLMNLGKITPEQAGMTTFHGKTFTYEVTFDVVETTKGSKDAIIGVYVNDTLVGGRHHLVKGVDAEVLERGLFSYVDKNGGALTMKSTDPKVDFTIFGLTDNWAKTLGIK